MNIKSIRTLVTIADHRSFQAAARVLNMSISNVSLQINALESHLGVRLFDRSTRPPRLTDSGAEFVVQCRELLLGWENLGDSIAQNRGRGRLKVGAVHTAVAGGVSVALGRLHKQDIGLFVQLHTDLTTELIKQLQKHSIDCAIVTEPESPVLDMDFFAIAKEALGVIAHRDAAGENFRQILDHNPYIRFNRHATLARYIDAELRRRDIQVNSVMEVTTLDAVESLVKNALGVSVVPVGKSVRSLPKDIRTVPFTSPPVYRTLGLMVRHDCPRMHLVELLLQALYHAYDTSNQVSR